VTSMLEIVLGSFIWTQLFYLNHFHYEWYFPYINSFLVVRYICKKQCGYFYITFHIKNILIENILVMILRISYKEVHCVTLNYLLYVVLLQVIIAYVLLIFRGQNSVHCSKSFKGPYYAVGCMSDYCLCWQRFGVSILIHLENSY